MKLMTASFRTRRMHFRLASLGALLALALCSGCVYRIPIQQGNFLEAKDLDQVNVGMTRSQVRYLLGTPMVADPFDHSRWDYVYYLKRGRISNPLQRHFIVYFDGDKVAKIERAIDDQESKAKQAS
jgi:outer membrane protein assembly factor BamE